MTESNPLTLMAVHAHPDDEASSTGGVLARYAAEGVRTVVVTCTNGELGDAPGGIKPDEPGFVEDVVVQTRRAELEESCRILNVTHLERLGFRDSGMMGWLTNETPGAFWKLPVEDGARPLIALIERYRPQVLITYDANGFYGHPDHIQAHRITLFAAEATGIADKLYFPVIPRSAFAQMRDTMIAAGIEAPAADEPDFGTPDELVTTFVDCRDFVEAKRAALAAHRSQTEASFFMKLSESQFNLAFGREAFLREIDRSGATIPEEDLFAGLRSQLT